MYGLGPHGFGCHTATVPLRCRDCNERIFYFRCSHGSRVLFDDLGPPWPQHDCDRSWARGQRRSVDPDGRITVEITEGVTAVRLPDDFTVDPTIIDRAHRAARTTDRRPDDIVRQYPTPTADELYVGTLREIRKRVDPIKHFRLPSTPVAVAGLGAVGQQHVGRITVHVEFGEDLESYTAWIPTELLKAPAITRGALVEVQLVGTRILAPSPQVDWFCRSIEVLFA
jgi:hypothetical protein